VPNYPHHVTQRENRCQEVFFNVVTARPMLDMISNWHDYMSVGDGQQQDLIRKHQRTGRPLGCEAFIDKVEKLTGWYIRPKKPSPKKSFAK